MTTAQTILVLLWIAVVVASGIDLLVTGRISQYIDREMARHLWLVTLFAGLEPIGLLLAGLSVWPAVLITAGTLMVILWRILLRTQSRKARGRDTKEKDGGGDAS